MTLPPVPPDIVAAVDDVALTWYQLGTLDGVGQRSIEPSHERIKGRSVRNALALIQQALAAEGERAIRAAVATIPNAPGFSGGDVCIIAGLPLTRRAVEFSMLPEPKGGGA